MVLSPGGQKVDRYYDPRVLLPGSYFWSLICLSQLRFPGHFSMLIESVRLVRAFST